MSTYVVLLRAVNVGGTGKLPMADLRALCVTAGFEGVQTYIASGNIVLRSNLRASEVKVTIEGALAEYAQRAVGVVVLTAEELVQVLMENPFVDRVPSLTAAIFLDEAPGLDSLVRATGQIDEEVALGHRVFYVHYPNGMGRSKLRIPGAKDGTSRNMNTVAALVSLATDD